jgi:hypothetical protein
MATKTTISPHPGGGRTASADGTDPSPTPAEPTPGSSSSATGGTSVRPGPDLDWTDLDGRDLSDGDQITMVDSAGTGAHVTMTLLTPGNVTWWKDIEIQDSTGAVIAAAWTQDATHESLPLSVPNAAGLAGLQLVFKKAAFLGVHTPVYQIPSLLGKEGHTLTFTWRKDG